MELHSVVELLVPVSNTETVVDAMESIWHMVEDDQEEWEDESD